ncbi:branched-chain amino acid aminotransferase [Haematospirillum sp. H1815]|uniref:branched-chain amino acid aminotransferase n=1 Tax=Haematospirillum sp. H1815 TaxID=2723108 RepID=UPI00143929DE|nr:branched-chain amino acid aminotransferase [Haematospirillum sp. H1815]NKD76822.1 branched-chain amino acid aminotransferase [Haematospirillum sp. H1815]
MSTQSTQPGISLVFVDGTWHTGNPMIMGPGTQSVWMGSTAFDGARYYEGVVPDLKAHCERVVQSARILGLNPTLGGADIAALAREGITRSGGKKALYIKPMFWCDNGFLIPDASSTRFALHLFEIAMPPASQGFSATQSPFRRPTPDAAPTAAKAACLYPNVSRALSDAHQRGFDTAVMLDNHGNVAEFAAANLFLVKDGIIRTPVPNGSFLNGLTRQRVIALLQADGTLVEETTLSYDDLMQADEIFATGNFSKVSPCIQIEGRPLPHGHVTQWVQQLYRNFAFGHASIAA